MVLASIPVISVSRLAARPVGAHSHTPHFLGLKNRQDGLNQGGFPYPRVLP
jgi:hypothetical protein